MNVFPPMQNERLFVPFLDEVDGTLCLPSNATAPDIHSQARVHRLRFPLLLDEAKPLREQIAALLKDCGFRYAALDLHGYRRGSLNEVFAPPA